MKILHVIADLDPRSGGPAAACLGMAASVAALGHSVEIHTTDFRRGGGIRAPEREKRSGVLIHRHRGHPPRFWRASLPLARALAAAVPAADLVHLHSLYLFHGVVAGHLCRRHRVPYLLRPHGSLEPFIHRRRRWRKALAELLFENRNVRGAAALHFTLPQEAILAEPWTLGTRSAVAPLGVDCAAFLRPPNGRLAERFPETTGRRVLLFLGRITRRKGVDTLAEAFVTLAGHHGDLHLLLAGPDDQRLARRVTTRLDRAGLTGRYTLAGMVEGDLKLAAFHDSAVFVLPSRTENFGLAVVEAMAAGRPVVVSPQVHLSGEIARVGAGLVAPCAAAPVADAVRAILDHPEEARRMGESGRALATGAFDWPVVAPRLVAVYREIIDARGGGPAAVAGGGSREVST